MKINNVRKLQTQFTGKVCTILTKPIAKHDFNDTQFSDFFTGLIDFLDEDGIWTTHPTTIMNQETDTLITHRVTELEKRIEILEKQITSRA